MAYSIYSKAGTDEAISSALADSLPTTPADIGAATAAQGALADATTVEQVTLNANLDYTLPAGVPANTIHQALTRPGYGKRSQLDRVHLIHIGKGHTADGHAFAS